MGLIFKCVAGEPWRMARAALLGVRYSKVKMHDAATMQKQSAFGWPVTLVISCDSM